MKVLPFCGVNRKKRISVPERELGRMSNETGTAGGTCFEASSGLTEEDLRALSPVPANVRDVDTITLCGQWRYVMTGAESRTRLICAPRLDDQAGLEPGMTA